MRCLIFFLCVSLSAQSIPLGMPAGSSGPVVANLAFWFSADCVSLTGTGSVGVRNTSSAITGLSSITISLPSGSLAGDLAIMFVSGQNVISNPSGWTVLQNSSAANWSQGATYSKSLTPGDISTGSVTVSSTGAVITGAIVDLYGPGILVRESHNASANAATGTVNLTASGSVVSSDLGIYWASCRCSANPTINLGSVGQANNNGSNAAGVLYTDSSPSASETITSTYTGYNPQGYYSSAVFVESLGPATGACSVPSNGSTVSVWMDRSGNGHHALSSRSAATFNTNQINSNPAITLSGSELDIGGYLSISATNEHTIFVVWKLTSGFSNIQAIVGGPVEYWSNCNPNPPGALQGFAEDSSGTKCGTYGTAIADTSWHQVNGFFSGPLSGLGPSSGYRLDRATDTLIVNSYTGMNLSPPSMIGYSSSGNSWHGQVAEILYYNTVVSAGTITANETYLHNKYGL